MAGIIFLVGRAPPTVSTSDILSHSLESARFLLNNFLIVLGGVILFMISWFSFDAFKFFFIFNNLSIMCLGMAFSGFIYLVIFGLLEFGCSFPFPDLGSFQPLFL